VHPALNHLQADLSLFSLDDPLLSRPYLFAQLVNREMLDAAAPAAMERQLTVLSRLTQREREVAQLVRDGLSNEEIAAHLHKGVGTVKNQLQSIFAKLEINSRAKLISLLR
jgi:DNA-binding NarL/FixJ family response regulator